MIAEITVAYYLPTLDGEGKYWSTKDMLFQSQSQCFSVKRERLFYNYSFSDKASMQSAFLLPSGTTWDNTIIHY